MSNGSALSSWQISDAELSNAQFKKIASMLHEHCGIHMRQGKEGLVHARLAKRLRKLSIADFDSYLTFVERDTTRIEFREMVDALTTNKTNFFREPAHFDFVRDNIIPTLGHSARFWSAGCATGEEPYSLAMLLNESCSAVKLGDARILATDISQRVLQLAANGEYNAEAIADVPADLQKRYWSEGSSGGSSTFAAKATLRRLVNFARLNLMDQWPMHGPFDAIFCRNVMIYFDKETQQRLVERFWALLSPGGHLFVGHSESLTGTSHQFDYVQPAVYVR
ncbi:MAG: protein-glutamate O-methyltransferase CheR [Gemmatimonadaceae bacterium]